METMVLKEPTVSPTNKVLETALGKSFAAYEELMTLVSGKKYEFTPQWNYYNDGKAWLCKVQYKKKTIFWLSVWDKHFKLAFYFTKKNGEEINKLDISDNIKKNFAEHKPVGKLLPLALDIYGKKELKDALKIIEYKRNLK
jgi:hypothetical protein